LRFTLLCGRAVLSDSRQSKFGRNLVGGSIEIIDFGADVNRRDPLNYSVFTRQVQLGRSTKSGGISLFNKSKIYIKTFRTLLPVSITRSSSGSIYCSLLKL